MRRRRAEEGAGEFRCFNKQHESLSASFLPPRYPPKIRTFSLFNFDLLKNKNNQKFAYDLILFVGQVHPWTENLVRSQQKNMNFLPIFFPHSVSLETLSEPLISRENFWFIIDQTPLTFQCIKQDFWDWGHEIALNWSGHFLAVKMIFFFSLFFFLLSNKFTFLEKHSWVLSLIPRTSNTDASGMRPTEAATRTIWRDSSISYLSSGSYILLRFFFFQNCCYCVWVCVCVSACVSISCQMGWTGWEDKAIFHLSGQKSCIHFNLPCTA